MNLRLHFLLIFLCFACSTVKLPKGKVSHAEAHQAWARVLERFVDDDGWVDFKALEQSPEDLNRYVTYVSVTKPTKNKTDFPDSAHVLAHYINSYNALSMYNVIDSGIPRTHAGLRKVRFFALKKMLIGGTSRSLKNYEDEVIRSLGEPRIHFALNCMAAGCPRLPKRPFTGPELEAQLTDSTEFFFREKRNLVIDETKKTVFATEILDFFPEDFLVKSPSQIDFINQYVKTKIPADYDLNYIPYDWTVIDQSQKPKP